MKQTVTLQTPATGRDMDRQRGFTLIELSIVLVIIGLIIGGVLKGQEMIAGARLKAQVAQMDGLRAAVQSFQDKYKGLPGDFGKADKVIHPDAAGSADIDTPDDGAIGAAGAAIDPDVDQLADMAVALQHLHYAGYLAGVELDSADATNTKLQGRMPGTYVNIGQFALTAGGDRHAIRLQGDAADPTVAGLRTSDAFSFDSKYDDGDPEAGEIQAINNEDDACFAAGSYDLGADGDGETKNCALVWRID